MLGGLLGGDNMRVGVKAKGKLKPPSASEIDMGQAGSRRSAASILRVVRQHMPGLRHTYNKHLKKNPGFSGKIHIKFDIAPSGKTVRVSIVSTTTGVSAFDAEIKNKVRRWRFEPITGKGNDIVTIPFTFSE
ncbi:TonB family protein [Fibrobacterota bacterium]